VSHACARTYDEKHGQDTTSLFDDIIYNGLDLNLLPFSQKASSRAPLLFAGRITPEKGVEDAIEIAERAGLPLNIAGGIYDRSYYETRIAPRIEASHGRVTYLGQLQQARLWRVMSKSLGFLFPIEWEEPFGLAPVEAMATGTPVLAYRRGAMSEIIRHGETGFLIEPGDIAQAVAFVHSLPNISRTHCRVHVQQHFSLDRMLNEHERVYRRIT
jgi:glycosyltransferase involved in cell wall biosynthesis